MKIFVGIHLSLLFMALLVQTSREDDELCVPSNATYALCMANETAVTVVSESFSGEQLFEECHAHFMEELFGKPICHEHTDDEENKTPSAAQRYGYGFLAVFVISALSLAGLLAFPLMYKVSFQYVLVTFTALAVGTLFGDAMFHLIPLALGLHSHDSDEHEHGHEHEEEDHHSSTTVPVYQWRMFTAVMVLYGFYLLEIFLRWFTEHRPNNNIVHSHGHSHGIHQGGILQTNNNSSVKIDDSLAHDGHLHHHNYNEIDSTLGYVVQICPHQTNMPPLSTSNENDNANGKGIILDHPSKIVRATGWMIILGDGIHNFADGLAIGAAFSQELMLGLTTTIAIGCHELPHEFGDYAVLIQSGFSHCRALLWNVISATTAIVGFFVGAAVSTNENARQWIFSITIGMFLYIALVDLLPTLLPEGRVELKRLILVNIGFLVGIVIMFLLAIFEDKLIGLGH